MNRRDEFRYINFFDAMKVIRNSRNLFTTSIVLDHWVNNRKRLKKLIRLYKKDKEEPVIKEHIRLLVINTNAI